MKIEERGFHHIFDMIFLEGQAVYYHKEDICHFLEHVHGTDLLKVGLLDCKEDLYMAGTKSLIYIQIHNFTFVAAD